MPRFCRTPNAVLIFRVSSLASLAPSGHRTASPLREPCRGCRQAGIVARMSLSATARFVRARWLSALVGGLLMCALAFVAVGICVDADGQPRPGGRLRGHQRSVGRQYRELDGPRRHRRARDGLRLSAGRARRHDAGRLGRRHGVQRLPRGVQRSAVPDGRHRASGFGRRDADPGPVHLRGRRGHGRVDRLDPGRAAGIRTPCSSSRSTGRCRWARERRSS